MLAILFTVFAAISVALAHVSVDNPLDGQFPLIARIGENYTWPISTKTFSTDLDISVDYSALGLPAWLSFDNYTLTFYGVPAAADEGRPNITVTASDTESTISSSFILCVTPYPAPTVQKTISQQFYAGNPALSSIFFLSPGSALATNEPTLRVPAKWSFSIGLQWDTFVAENDLYYGALQSDGTPLPPWITFDPSTAAFDGVAPNDEAVPTPILLEINVFGADQQGYSAASVRFGLVVATHELSAYTTLPTINVTAGAPFNVSVSSPADFSGVLVDGQALQPANVSALSIDVSSYKDWLKYDPGSRTLFGAPPSNFTDGKPTLPVSLTSNFNETLYTSVSLDVVPSYFIKSDFGTIEANPGQEVLFDLTKYFANPSAQHKDANLSASYNPSSASKFLTFNPDTAQLAGRIPADSDIPSISVMFVAYSYVTHSTSHAMLSVESPELEKVGGSGVGGVGTPSKAEATLIVSLVFSIIGGVFFLGFALALFRRCARVKDSAVLGEEGTRAWTDEEKRWYGIGIEVRERNHERGYGWSNQGDTSALSEKGSLETQAREGSFDRGYYPPNRSYNNLGLGLRRVLPHAPTTPSTVQASCAEGVMKKAEFFGKIKNTARNVSDRYRRRSPPIRPNISHPLPLVRRDGIVGTPIEGQYVEIVKSPPRAESASSIRDDHLTERRASTVVSFTTSPSNSTGERSIPRRRADFAPPNSPRGPRAPAPAAVRDTSRRSLVRDSLQSTSAISADSHPDSLRPGEERPRLKQFTHASRVPPPRSPSNNVAEPDASSGARRIVSQTAEVYKETQAGRHTSIDELRIGMHYVRTLGEGSSNVRSVSDKSFSSLESSQQGHGAAGGTKSGGSARFLVRAGEKFRFKVPMQHAGHVYRKLEARLMSGRALPSFLQAELKGFGKGDEKKAVEFYGVPAESDIGELYVGVFNAEGAECLARVVVEVVARGKKTPPMAG